MAKEKIEQLVEGGKASAAPPLGPALGPMGVNIAEVVAAINQKTASFKGMQVPITIEIDRDTKKFEISVGTPPASALIKKEAGIPKGSGSPAVEKVADLKIEQIIKISKMKEDDLLGKTSKDRVKEIIGTCVSMGVMVEGVEAKEAIKRVNAGEFDEKIASGKTELTEEELKALEAEKAALKAKIEKRRKEYEILAKEIGNKFEKKSASVAKKAFVEAGIPEEIYKNYMPKGK
ncbi:50S ribosomal protein L11 [Candidatus Woesearchaeota archaeon]|nr:50S ribosomal protein L11 [Candidatus Woesearchaeota archaeon]